MEVLEHDTERRRATRQRLVEAALMEFGRRGIDATTVEQLCEAAGFSRGAFYSNFSTKDDICEAVARVVAEETVSACRGVLAQATGADEPAELIGRLLGVVALTPERHRTLMELELRGIRDEAFAARLRSARQDVWPVFREVAVTGSARVGVEFVVSVDDVLRVLEALFYSPHLAADGSNMRLVALIADSLTRRVDGHHG